MMFSNEAVAAFRSAMRDDDFSPLSIMFSADKLNSVKGRLALYN